MLAIEPLFLEHLPLCQALLAVFPAPPYAYLASPAAAASLSRLWQERVRSSLAADGASGLWVQADGARALAIWRYLPWDSEHLGFACARLDHLLLAGGYEEQQALGDPLLDAVLEQCQSQGVQYLWARLDSSDFSTLHLLERHGFVTVDSILTFALRLGSTVGADLSALSSAAQPGHSEGIALCPSPCQTEAHRPKNPSLCPQRGREADSSARGPQSDREDDSGSNVRTDGEDDRGRVFVRLARAGDRERLKQIARSAYVHDRFHSDPLISPTVADNVYAVWVENSCLGTAADAVVVAEWQGQVCAYVTCTLDREAEEHLGLRAGSIVLVATAAEARGQGLARVATAGALDWFRSQGVDVVEVGTQLRNVPAARLYEGLGFRLAATSVSVRRWLG